LAVQLCEGAFPLMETDEMNFGILEGAARALVPGGKMILTTLNGLYPLIHAVGKFENQNLEDAESSGHHFDPLTFRMRSTLRTYDHHGRTLDLDCDERWYIPSEMTWLLKQAGFRNVEIFGARLGAFSRADALTADDFEMLILAERAGA
jgi:hypothetical protein